MTRFGREILSRVIAETPEIEWFIVLDGKKSRLPFEAPNLKVLHAPISADNPLGMVIFLEYWITKYCKKTRADFYFSPDGWTPLTLKIPAIPSIHDVNFEVNPRWLPYYWSLLYHLYFKNAARKAIKILTVSEFSKNEIVKYFGVPRDKILVIYNAPCSDFRVLKPEEKNLVRRRFSCGQPYFLAPTMFHPRKNIAILLEAYAMLLEKNENIPMLLFTGGSLWPDQKTKIIYRKLCKKNKVHMLDILDQEEISMIFGAAEAVIYISKYEGFGLPVVDRY